MRWQHPRLGLKADENDAAIVRSAIDLSRNLGLSVTAEGVEDEATWTILRELGCTEAQGFYVSPALPADDLEAWVRNGSSGLFATPSRA